MSLHVLKTVRSPKGYLIVPVHYRHDPDKDLAWEMAERKKYALEADWNREQEFDTREVRGTPAYPSFTHILHVTDEIELIETVPLCLAMDFNVSPMVWEVCQIINNELFVLDEIMLDPAGIPTMMNEFKNRYPRHGADVYIYGDATGSHTSSLSNQSHYDLVSLGFRSYPCPIVYKVPLQNPAVKARIDAMNSKLKNSDGAIGVHVHPKCRMLIDDFAEVVLEKGGNSIHKAWRPEDPYSKRTHACLAGDTIIWTPDGEAKIKDLACGDFILLPHGKRRILAVSDRLSPTLKVSTSRGEIEATADHKFLTERGLVTTDALRYNDVILTWGHPICQSVCKWLMESNSTWGLRDAITELTTEWERMARDVRLSTCIDIFGVEDTVGFLMDAIFTTKTEIPSTIPSRILNVLRQTSIYQSMAKSIAGRLLGHPRPFSENIRNALTHGTGVLKAEYGIASTAKESGRKSQRLNLTALNAEDYFRQSATEKMSNSAEEIARWLREENQEKTRNQGLASFAAGHSSLIDMPIIKPVVESVGGASESTRVYDMTIDYDHCYFANGFLVSNSDALGYLIYREWPVFKELAESRKRRNRNAPRQRKYQRIIGQV